MQHKFNIELFRDDFGVFTTSINISFNLKNRKDKQYRHADLLRKIKNILIETPTNFSERNFALVEYIDEKGELRPFYKITKDGLVYLIMKINNKTANELSIAYINQFNEMHQALNHLHFKLLDKKHQLLRMEDIHNLLTDEEKKVAVNYIKANTVVNKITSDIHHHPKMLKKDQMSPTELATRQKILDDYVKAFELTHENSLTNDVLRTVYKKQLLLS